VETDAPVSSGRLPSEAPPGSPPGALPRFLPFGPHLLVIDDDARLRSLLLRYLQTEGFSVSTVASVKEAEKALKTLQFDLLILDVMMPDITGFAFLSSRIAQASLTPPVLFLSAMGDPEHRIQGLERGAEDYLAKPFDPRELVLRIQAILRRSGNAQALLKSITLGAFIFFPEEGSLQKGNEKQFLPTAELKLLKALMASLDKPVRRETLAVLLKEPSQLRTVDVQVNRLRQRIEEDPKHPQVLLTIRGEGYMLRGRF
jgi:two-component system, OmpR family, phosphate regulon response regulator OmpR